MKTQDLDRKKSPCAWWAVQDARMASIKNESHYSAAQKIAADSMAQVLPLVYSTKEVHINYRQRFITIKVDSPRVIDRKNLAFLEEDWSKKGYKKLATDQGVIYRIPRV